MQNIYYIDGDFVNSHDAKIPIADLGFVRGYGVFDFFRTYNGVPFHLDDHLARLHYSACAVELDFPWTFEELSDIVAEVVARNGNGEHKVRIIITGGDTEDFSSAIGSPRLVIVVTPCSPMTPLINDNAVKAITIDDNRMMPDVKSINYISAVIAVKRAKKVGATEGLYVDKQGYVWEGTRTNLFAFFGDTLVTTGHNILKGITRQTVLKLADGLMPVDVRNLKLEELMSADEVFITSSSKEILPVVAVDDRQIGGGKIGQHTQHLQELFRDYVINWAK
jgi:branched-chain amino acid aminotransferase